MSDRWWKYVVFPGVVLLVGGVAVLAAVFGDGQSRRCDEWVMMPVMMGKQLTLQPRCLHFAEEP